MKRRKSSDSTTSLLQRSRRSYRGQVQATAATLDAALSSTKERLEAFFGSDFDVTVHASALFMNVEIDFDAPQKATLTVWWYAIEHATETA